MSHVHPFRATASHRHSTWARTFHSHPELHITPHTIPEVQDLVARARRSRRRIVVVGAAHSPSDLTCTSAWMVSLAHLSRILKVWHDDKAREHRVLVQAGITLEKLNHEMVHSPHRLAMSNLGSINVQSLAGALATATHGSSLHHATLGESVRGMRVVLADGSAVWCSPSERAELFRAALVSLGAIGIVVEVEFAMAPAANLEWSQHLIPLSQALDTWNTTLWTQDEYVRCFLHPYTQRLLVWHGSTTAKPATSPKSTWNATAIGKHIYQSLLWLSNHIPPLLPLIERLIFGLQTRFSPGMVDSAVQPRHTALLMDCLYSQFVNEWALPLRHGPEALSRLSAWLHGDVARARIPFSPNGLYVHCPVEVRVSDSSAQRSPRAFLDTTMPDGPTLYLNATLYRAYHADPPCRARYYQAFEWLMRDLGGRPHWAKNFGDVSPEDFRRMYGADFDVFLRVRGEVDPEGLFVGAWHRRFLLGELGDGLALEEKEAARWQRWGGGVQWVGHQTGGVDAGLGMSVKGGPRSSRSEESFDSFNASTESGEEIEKGELEGLGH